MSNKATPGSTLGLILTGLALAVSAVAQTPDWRPVGNAAIDLELAGLATGPVDRVWYSPAGDQLWIRASSGKIFETSDFDRWTAVPPENVVVPPAPGGRSIGFPENGAQIRNPVDPSPRVYAFGQFVYRSDNSGKNWDNLTAFHGMSILGDGLHDLAISPSNEDEIVVAGTAGVFRSLDGGQSWSGLNESLPNLPAVRIQSLPQGPQGAEIELPGAMVVEWQPGERLAWRPADNAKAAGELALRQLLSSRRGAAVTALATKNGDQYIYTGMADGRIIVSADSGVNWQPDTRIGQSGAVTAFWVDPADSRIALAVLASRPHGAEGIPPRVLHTIDGGLSWDDVSANLPDLSVRGVTADPDGNAIYVATDQGVFFARANLNVLSVAPAAWTKLAGLPPVAATDVMLDSGAIQLWVALEGYGLYQTMAPHRAGDPRLITSAGLIARAAAPGTVFSIEGARVNSANAGGLPVPVLAATDSESQIQIPFEASGDSLALSIDGPAGARVLPSVPLVSTAPAIQLDPRDGAPLLLDADNGVLLDAMHPAHSHARIQILATGLGRVQPNWPTGLPAPADPPHTVAAPVRVLLDRVPVQVTRAILYPNYVGVYLVEIEIPNIVNYGPAELYIEVDGQPSNRVRVYIEP